MRPVNRPLRAVLPDGREVIRNLAVARTVLARARGLLGRAAIGADGVATRGLLIPRCRCVHTFFMKFGIGLIFVDKENVVVSVRDNVAPWRVAWERRAAAVIECAAASPPLRMVRPGDRLSWTSERPK